MDDERQSLHIVVRESLMKPRGLLMIEHRLIEKFLAATTKLSKAMGDGRYDPILIDTIVDFIRTYADRTHHGKEEDILFRKLAKKELAANDLVAMNTLIDEHTQARARVKQIVELNERYRNGEEKVVSQIVEVIQWLGDFYPTHIRKEDKEFFPQTERYFSDQERDTLLQDFRTFDGNMIHEKYSHVFEVINQKAKG